MRNLTVKTLSVILFVSSFAIQAFAIEKQKKQEKKEMHYDYNYAAMTGKCGIYDPYESFNRKIYIFNGVLDTFILRPITKGYAAVTNEYTRNRVTSVVENVKVPLTTFNYIIQGDAEGTYKSFWRFAINSTFGVFGLFDVASKVGLAPKPQTFGSTLARYGVGPGPYIVLPFFGGTSARDVTDSLFTNSNFNVVNYYTSKGVDMGITVATLISARHQIMPFTDYVTKNSPDSYIAIRDAILSQREAQMKYPSNFKCPVAN